MTREGLINGLKIYEKTADTQVEKRWVRDAIEYLEQEHCDDTISRNDTLEKFAQLDATDGTEPIFSGRRIQEILNDMPSVQPTIIHKDRTVQDFVDKCLECGRMRKGHWKYFYQDYECSECGFVVPDDEYMFCPMCGCRMVGETDG